MTDLNGWNVEEMTAAVEGVKAQPDAGKLTWRSTALWDGGFGLDVRVKEIEQLGQVMPRRFTLRGDHPPELLGKNTGPTAIEALAAALGSCMAGTFAAQATGRGVKIDSLEIDIETSIDLNGFFGLTNVRRGLLGVKLDFRVKSDASKEVLDEILDATRQQSPVFDSIARPVTIETTVRK